MLGIKWYLHSYAIKINFTCFASLMESRKCKMMYATCSSDDGRKRIMGT